MSQQRRLHGQPPARVPPRVAAEPPAGSASAPGAMLSPPTWDLRMRREWGSGIGCCHSSAACTGSLRLATPSCMPSCMLAGAAFSIRCARRNARVQDRALRSVAGDMAWPSVPGQLPRSSIRALYAKCARDTRGLDAEHAQVTGAPSVHACAGPDTQPRRTRQCTRCRKWRPSCCGRCAGRPHAWSRPRPPARHGKGSGQTFAR